MHNAYVIEVKELRPHNNADKLQILTCFGNDTCVSLDIKIGQIGVYFPCDLQLSEEFCEINHLCRKKKDGTPDTGYMDPDKRNVTAIRLRGEKSDGLFLPLSSLDYCFEDGKAIAHLKVGDIIDGLVNGHEICCKYIPRSNARRNHTSDGNRTRKKKVATAPLFKEHADTEQLAYNLGAFKVGDEIEITLKMHGTSQRTGHLPTLHRYKKTFWEKVTRKEGTPIYDWGYVSGTRRVVLESYDGGFYGSNEFREQHSKVFEGKLNKGETVYYEVVGFTTDGTPIMGSGDNKKLNDKNFIKQYGEKTIFSYGCKPIVSIDCDDLQSDIYVYRMTMTNEDGDVVEYTPDFMRYRCEQMGVKTVPVFGKAIISADRVHFVAPDGYDHDYLLKEGMTLGDIVMKIAEEFYDGADPVGKTHVREGVVVRIINRPKFAAFKHKNFSFKCLEGLVKAEAAAPDMEEAQEVEVTE